jgi:penicillin-binding protein 2
VTGVRDNPLNDVMLRVRLLLALMTAGLVLLGAVLWKMQVRHAKRYEVSQVKQSIRRVRIPGTRGRIFDRAGVCLADNRPSYGVALYLEELRRPGRWSRTIAHVEEIVERLSGVIGLAPQIGRDDIEAHIQRRLPLPLLAWRDVGDAALARLAERAASSPGVDVYAEAVRSYPFGRLACHTLGYVGRSDDAAAEEEPYHYYLPELEGKSGLEKSLDASLRGEAGGRLLRVDVAGFRRSDIGGREARAGSDVMLTLDRRIQAAAEQALGEEPGAAVVIDPSTGDILALASSPGFDLNAFVPRIGVDAWTALIEDERKPLLNRAAAGSYAPGSTFKPVVAMAALESGKFKSSQSFHCPGYFELGRARFRCWLHEGHGDLVLRQAIEQSCNVYFFQAGLQCGHEAIEHMAMALGLGQKTGVELDFEVEGMVPNEGWKKRVHGDAWRDGDTCNLSIGQGAMSVTPLQMAMVASVFANGGTVYRPRIVRGFRRPSDDRFEMRAPEVVNRMNWTPDHIRVVREGMRDVIQGDRGSARRIAIPGIEMAGKTGTAEFGRKDDRLRHAWMIAFAPFEKPKYAVALLVDEGVSGGETAAPRMGELMAGIFAADGEPKG